MTQAGQCNPLLGWLCIAICLTVVQACGGAGGSSEPPAVETPDKTGIRSLCIADLRNGHGQQLHLAAAFGGAKFNQPTDVAFTADGNGFVTERGGSVYRVSQDGTPVLALDLSQQVDIVTNGGLLGIAAESSDWIYLIYTQNAPYRLILSRFHVFASGQVDQLSESKLLEVPHDSQNPPGAGLAIGPDGYLYVSIGSAQNTDAQDATNLNGSIVRIDINKTDALRLTPYAIPEDNPFASNITCANGGCPEIFAMGLRNPGQLGFDASNNQLWLLDHGDQWQEFHYLNSGDNAGWPCREGQDATGVCSVDDYINPVNQIEGSIVAATVYRGKQLEDLYGDLIYAERKTGEIFALYDPYGSNSSAKILDTGAPITGFANTPEGELVFFTGNGLFYQLTPGNVNYASGFPESLADTGCADADDPSQAMTGMLPYEINTPLWTDRADKKRWFSLPPGTHISVDDDGHWRFPVGSVLRKDFYLDGQLIETRLLARHKDGGWEPYSYMWNEQGTDAGLLPGGGQVDFNGQRWTYPNRGQCFECHSGIAGRSLGLDTGQMNRRITPPGTASLVNQIDWLRSQGALIEQPAQQIIPAQDDQQADLADRARAYLHANCSFCHRPGGNGGGQLDLRYTVSFEQMNICDVSSGLDDLGQPSAKLLYPGDPSLSLLSLRMHTLDGARMPPLGTGLEDKTGTLLIDTWIQSVSNCTP